MWSLTQLLLQNIQEESDSISDVTQHCLDDMVDKWISNCDSKSWKKIKQ